LTDEDLNLEALKRTYCGRGSRPHRADLLLKLVIYEHSQARYQAVQWFKDLEENKAVQWLTFGMKPSLTTLYEFRDRAKPLLRQLNHQVVRTAIDEGHTDGSCGALDGTTVAANASRHRLLKRKKNNRIRVALGDPTAPFGLDKLKTYRPLYNVQTMSDVDTDLVLAYETTATTADNGQLLPMIDRTIEATNRTLEAVLVDSGYPSGEDLARCKKSGVVVYAPWNENSFTEVKRSKAGKERQIPKDQFSFDPSVPGYRCPEGKMLRYRERTKKQKANGDYVTLEIYQADRSDCGACPLVARCVHGRSGARTVRRQEHEELIDELKERMKQPEGKKKYRKRGCTVERRFADLKTHRGLQRFSGRKQERADAQVGFTVLAHNLETLDKLRIRKREAQENAGKIAS